MTDRRLRPYAAAIRLGLIVTLVLAIPPVVAAQYLRATVEAELGEVDRAERLRGASVTAQLVGEALTASGNDLELLSSRRLVREALASGDPDAIGRHLADLRAVSTRYASAAAFDPAGVMIARDPMDPVVGRSFAGRDDVEGALATQGPYVSEAYLSSSAPARPLVAVTLAVRDGLRVIGILQATTAASQLLDLIAPTAGVEGREVLIVDDQRRVIASTAGRAALSTSPLSQFDGGPAATLAPVEGLDRLVALVPVPGAAWSLAVLDDPAVALAPQRRVGGAVDIALAGVLLAAIVLGYAIAWLSEQRRRAALQTEQALQAQQLANAELVRLDQAKSEFVSIVSHEFRTPLTGILGFSELIRDEPLGPAEVREYAEDIHGEANRLARLVNDMLDLDRMRSGQMRLRPTALDMNATIREAIEGPARTPVGHEVRLELAEDLPPVTADRDRLIQIVTNLVSNAAKYSPGGGTITLKTTAGPDEALLEVRDEGVGIPQEAQSTLFDRFTRVENDATRGIGGTGLGLPIVKQIVELHGGRIWVESTPGVGSTFTVTLPLAPAGDPRPAGPPE